MAQSEEPPILPPAPEGPPPPAPPTAAIARPAAQSTLAGVATSLDRAMANVATGRATAESWTDDFWAVSGYDKAAVLAAFDTLDTLVKTYNTQYDDAIRVLKD